MKECGIEQLRISCQCYAYGESKCHIHCSLCTVLATIVYYRDSHELCFDNNIHSQLKYTAL